MDKEKMDQNNVNKKNGATISCPPIIKKLKWPSPPKMHPATVNIG